MSASGKGSTERAKQWAKVNLENVVGAKLWKDKMCGWNSSGLAKKVVKKEYGGWEWRTLSSAVRMLWPSVVKRRGSNGATDYLTDVRLKTSRYCDILIVFFSFSLRLKFVGFLFSSPHQGRRRRRRRKSKLLLPQEDLRRRRRRESKLVL